MHNRRPNNSHNYPLTACIHWRFKLSVRSKIGYCDVINQRSLATGACIQSWEGVHWRWQQYQMAPAIVSKRGFLALVLWVLKGRNWYRVIIRIETGHSNLVSYFGPRMRALARYFTSAFASVKYLSQRPHPRAKHDTRFEWPVLILQLSNLSMIYTCRVLGWLGLLVKALCFLIELERVESIVM